VYAKWLSPKMFFRSKCTANRLAFGLSLDLVGELTALPQTLSWTKGMGPPGRGGEDKMQREEVKG